MSRAEDLSARKLFSRELLLWEARLWRTPALYSLIAFALGIYLQQYNESHRWGLICLVCGSFYLSLLSLFRLHYYLLRLYRWLYIGGITLCLLGLAMLRTYYSPQANRSTAPYEQTERIQAIKEIEEVLKRQGLSNEAIGLCSALSLGYFPRTQENKALRERFALSGVAHLLVVSGFHLGLIAYLLSFLLKGFSHKHPRLYYILLIAGIWGFTHLSGWAIPTVRASIMLSLYFVGRLLGRETQAVNILACSALIQLAYQPHYLYNWGMWLSYVAVLSILLYSSAIFKLWGYIQNNLLRYLWSLISLNLAVQILLIPLILHLFGYISWSFLIISLPMSLLASFLIPISLLVYACTYIGVNLSILTDTMEFLADIMLTISQWGSTLSSLILSYKLPLWALLVIWFTTGLVSITLRRIYPSNSFLYTH